jgi:uncharacterized membrane protein YesL
VINNSDKQLSLYSGRLIHGGGLFGGGAYIQRFTVYFHISYKKVFQMAFGFSLIHPTDLTEK